MGRDGGEELNELRAYCEIEYSKRYAMGILYDFLVSHSPSTARNQYTVGTFFFEWKKVEELDSCG